MPNFYRARNKSLNCIYEMPIGYWLELDAEGKVTILLKFSASIISSIVKGCPINLVLRNPKIAERSTTIYIYDNLKSPFWVTWQEFSEPDEKYKEFDKVMIDLVESKIVRIALYNELDHPVFSTFLNKKNEIAQFDNWYRAIPETFINKKAEKSEDGYYLPENNEKGFTIKLENKDNSSDANLIIYSTEEFETWGKEWIVGKDNYNLLELLKDGKHGYNQELSIRGILSKIFTPHEELFFSPKKIDDTELIDFFIHYKGAILIMESKFVISEKQTKLNKAISKAVKQLINAQYIISKETETIEDKRLQEKILNSEIILGLCLYNGALDLSEKNCKNIIDNSKKEELPIFCSVTNFIQLASIIKSANEEYFKYNLIKNLLEFYIEFLESEENILVIKEFKLVKEKVE